jgi:hypothetical protein
MQRALLAVFLAGCGGGSSSPDRDTLFETGLCVDPACSQISGDVIEYQPRFELWANTATKRRWMQIPAGAKIDTSDMDRWVFPTGTRVWKEFTRDGVRVETRLIAKEIDDDSAPNAWSFAAYEWNAEQTEAVLVPPEGSRDANGTMHDIPTHKECKECHDQLRPSRLLGVEAIQLDFDSPLADLQDLIAMGLLTTPPAGATPFFPLPGDATVQAALGYLHANCGDCHSPTSYAYDDTMLDLRLLTTKLGAVAETPTYLTTVNAPAFGDVPGTIVRPKDADHSVLIEWMSSPFEIDRMPPLATELVDPQGQTVLRAWIDSL